MIRVMIWQINMISISQIYIKESFFQVFLNFCVNFTSETNVEFYLPKQKGTGLVQDRVLFQVPVPVLWSHLHVLQSPQSVQFPCPVWPIKTMSIYDFWKIALTEINKFTNVNYWFQILSDQNGGLLNRIRKFLPLIMNVSSFIF